MSINTKKTAFYIGIIVSLCASYFIWPTPYIFTTNKIYEWMPMHYEVRKSRIFDSYEYKSWLQLSEYLEGESNWSKGSSIVNDPDTGWRVAGKKPRLLHLVYSEGGKEQDKILSFEPWLKVTIKSQAWRGMGTSGVLMDSDKEVEIPPGLVSLDVAIEITNKDNEWRAITGDEFYLASEKHSVLITSFGIITDNKISNFSIYPDETKILNLNTSWDYEELNEFDELVIIHPKYGWRWKVPELPPHKELFHD